MDYDHIVVQLFITESCNQKCKYCMAVDIMRERKKVMSMDDIDRFIWYMKTRYKFKFIDIEILGGEPMMHPDICNIIDKLYNSFDAMSIELYTNLSFPYQMYDKLLERFPHMLLQSSFHGIYSKSSYRLWFRKAVKLYGKYGERCNALIITESRNYELCKHIYNEYHDKLVVECVPVYSPDSSPTGMYVQMTADGIKCGERDLGGIGLNPSYDIYKIREKNGTCYCLSSLVVCTNGDVCRCLGQQHIVQTNIHDDDCVQVNTCDWCHDMSKCCDMLNAKATPSEIASGKTILNGEVV